MAGETAHILEMNQYRDVRVIKKTYLEKIEYLQLTDECTINR